MAKESVNNDGRPNSMSKNHSLSMYKETDLDVVHVSKLMSHLAF